MMQRKKIDILVLDGASSPFRDAVLQAVSHDPGLSVLAENAADGNVEPVIRRCAPDVIILNERAWDGAAGLASQLDRLRLCSEASPVPCIVIGPGAPDTIRVAGEHDAELIRLTDSASSAGMYAFGNEVCTKVKLAANAAAVMRMTAAAAYTTAAARPTLSPSAPQPAQPAGTPKPTVSVPKPTAPSGGDFRYHVVAIGASTGGTEATAAIMRELPADMPGIVITQHMPADFTRMYAERLDRISQLSVAEAKDGDRVQRGRAFVAPGGLQMYLKKDAHGYYIHCAPGEKVNGHCPSVGELFDSAAQCAGRDAVGVILTGMGKDGAEALLRMRGAGAFTIGQDRESCVVYGMPMVAYDIGAVTQQLPLDKIADVLAHRVHG